MILVTGRTIHTGRKSTYNETIGELKKELGIGLFILSLVCDPPRDVSVL